MIYDSNFEYISDNTEQALEVYQADDTAKKTFKLKFAGREGTSEGAYYRHLEDGYMVYEYLS